MVAEFRAFTVGVAHARLRYLGKLRIIGFAANRSSLLISYLISAASRYFAINARVLVGRVKPPRKLLRALHVVC